MAAGKYNLSLAANIAFEEWTTAWATEIFRLLTPGAYIASFGSPRTYHRMASGIENAGFEIRDQLAWTFGSGFPKSHNLEGDREGWGTALKPGWEPICLARKPIEGTVAENVAKYGTGAINIDGCRVPVDAAVDAGQLRTMKRSERAETDVEHNWGMNSESAEDVAVVSEKGRWPANVLHDGSDEVLACFPKAAGAQAAVTGLEPSAASDGTRCFNAFARTANSIPRIESEESAARFFYCAKASRADRNAGCEGMPSKELLWSSGTQSPGTFQSAATDRSSQNFHPTVKPTELMRWLCRLITPPGGEIIDCMMGSGSTGRGAVLEGFDFYGVEREAPYFEIAKRRIAEAQGELFAK